MEPKSDRPDDTGSLRSARSIPTRPTVPSLHGGMGTALQSTAPLVLTVRRRTLTPWLVVLAILVLVWIFRETLTLAFVAFSAAYVLAPSVRRIERIGIPRPLAIVIVLLGGAALVAGVMSKLVPEVVRQLQTLVAALPRYASEIQQTWIPWINKKFHVSISNKTGEAFSQLGLKASSFTPKLTALLDNTVEYTIHLLGMLFTGIIIAALTSYFLMEMEATVDGAFELVPHRARSRVRSIAGEIDRTLRDFIQGQLLVMLILGALFAVGLGTLGIPAGWAIGVFAGMISFVPYIGFFIALGLALLMALLEAKGMGHVVSVLVVMLTVHVLDFTIITPRIVGGKAKLSPIAVILSLIAGGSVFGFIGILLAIPVASVLRVLLRELLNFYQSTAFFLVGQAPIPLEMIETDPLGSTPPIPPGPLSAATMTMIPEDLRSNPSIDADAPSRPSKPEL